MNKKTLMEVRHDVSKIVDNFADEVRNTNLENLQEVIEKTLSKIALTIAGHEKGLTAWLWQNHREAILNEIKTAARIMRNMPERPKKSVKERVMDVLIGIGALIVLGAFAVLGVVGGFVAVAIITM